MVVVENKCENILLCRYILQFVPVLDLKHLRYFFAEQLILF